MVVVTVIIVVVVFLGPGDTKTERPSLWGTRKGKRQNINAVIIRGCKSIWTNEGAFFLRQDLG